MRKEDKRAIIKRLVVILNEYANFYLTDIATLNAANTGNLRRECNTLDIKLVVVKNTLFKKALKQIGGDYSALDSVLKGNTTIMFSNNSNSPARLIKAFAYGTDIPKLKAAYVQEEFYIGAENLELLVSIKSKNELIGDIVALLQSPVKNVIAALQAGGGQTVHGILKTIMKNKTM